MHYMMNFERTGGQTATPAPALSKARRTNLVRVDSLEVCVENSSADSMRNTLESLDAART